jgi:hypothetical protein
MTNSKLKIFSDQFFRDEDDLGEAGEIIMAFPASSSSFIYSALSTEFGESISGFWF